MFGDKIKYGETWNYLPFSLVIKIEARSDFCYANKK